MQTMDTIAVFGATGKVGSGVLEAMMLNNDVNRIHVITRRSSPLIDEGVKSGSIEMTTHMDYTNYEALADLLKEVKSVYWALGTSALNVSDEQYSVIHVDFPLAFVKEWIRITGGNKKISFHLISGAAHHIAHGFTGHGKKQGLKMNFSTLPGRMIISGLSPIVRGRSLPETKEAS